MAKAYCPVCGEESGDRAPGTAETAVCSARCGAAFAALALLRRRESESEILIVRRREEAQAASEPHTPVLSELLLRRWRSGDWTVEPDQVIGRL